MKRKLLVCIIILLACLLSACGSKTVSSAEDVLYASLEVVPQDTLPALMETSISIFKQYYGLSEVECADYAGQISILNVYATEILVVRAQKKNVEAVTSALEARSIELAAQWEASREEQHQLVLNAQIVQNGDWVLFVIAERADLIVEAFLVNTTE